MQQGGAERTETGKDKNGQGGDRKRMGKLTDISVHSDIQLLMVFDIIITQNYFKNYCCLNASSTFTH